MTDSLLSRDSSLSTRSACVSTPLELDHARCRLHWLRSNISDVTLLQDLLNGLLALKGLVCLVFDIL